MLELLISNNPRAYIPDSGPGPKTLEFGDRSAGFFGLVSTEELLSSREVVDKVALPHLSHQPITTWLKFYYRGEVLFIPDHYLMTGVDFEGLYRSGLIHADRDHEPLPGRAKVLEPYYLSKETSLFKVRTITGWKASNEPLPSNPRVAVFESEWTDLIYRVVATVVSGYPEERWGNHFRFSTGTYEAIANYLYESDEAIYRSYGGVDNIVKENPQAEARSLVWRPVLVYVPTSELSPLHGFGARVTDLIEPVGVEAVNQAGADDGLSLSPLMDFELDVSKPNLMASSTTVLDYHSPILRVVNAKSHVKGLIGPCAVNYEISESDV